MIFLSLSFRFLKSDKSIVPILSCDLIISENERKAMFQAKDVMTKDVICVRIDTPISEATDIMVNNGISGVPVVEENMILVGILSEHDVLRLLHTYKQERDRTVGEFMTHPVVYFKENDSLLDVCYSLRDSSIRRIPVTSGGKVTGIISRADVLRCIQRLLQEPCHAGSE
jgi:CBS domain-containing protein